MDYDDPYGFSNDEIELSSDEEAADPTDVSLVCLNRPVPTKTTVECLEIGPSGAVQMVSSKQP